MSGTIDDADPDDAAEETEDVEASGVALFREMPV
jgi:hypothetical protein